MHPSDGLTFVPQLIALIFVYPKTKTFTFPSWIEIKHRIMDCLRIISLNLNFKFFKCHEI